jgi:RNA-directed DNA polymerase
MNDSGKSDSRVVPAKPPNKPVQTGAEVVEERRLAKGNTDNPARAERSVGQGVSQGLDRVRQVAARDKEAQFTALLHHVTPDRLRTAYGALRPMAAPGVDGVTWKAYGQNLEANLQDLHERLNRGAYRAKPTRRVSIPKADGRERPLGITTVEDKILQRAVAEALNPIYETDFVGFSYGFRPGRSPHHALDALTTGITRKKVNWVLDADIRDFFGSLDRGLLMKFLEHRIGDKRVLRLIHKWLNAGVIEKGTWTESAQGTIQGATISPLLANVYLHYVFDLWAQQWRSLNARGDMIVVRFADDAVLGFEHRADAEQFLSDLRERLTKFGLELQAEKTRRIEFGRFAASNRQKRGLGWPETFDYLGFTHICGNTKGGQFMVKRVTIAKRMRAKLKAVSHRLKQMRHRPIPEQGKWLRSVVRGHIAYYAVPGNRQALWAFRGQVTLSWYKALRRRSQRTRMTWKRMRRIADRSLPPLTITHPLPEVRFDARTRGRSPVR